MMEYEKDTLSDNAMPAVVPLNTGKSRAGGYAARWKSGNEGRKETGKIKKILSEEQFIKWRESLHESRKK